MTNKKARARLAAKALTPQKSHGKKPKHWHRKSNGKEQWLEDGLHPTLRDGSAKDGHPN
jgi:hypothetical protein